MVFFSAQNICCGTTSQLESYRNHSNSVILTKEMSNAHDNAPHISFTILLAEHFFLLSSQIPQIKKPEGKNSSQIKSCLSAISKKKKKQIQERKSNFRFSLQVSCSNFFSFCKKAQKTLINCNSRLLFC